MMVDVNEIVSGLSEGRKHAGLFFSDTDVLGDDYYRFWDAMSNKEYGTAAAIALDNVDTTCEISLALAHNLADALWEG